MKKHSSNESSLRALDAGALAAVAGGNGSTTVYKTFVNGEGTLPFAEGTLPFAEGTLPFAEGTLPFAEGTLPFADFASFGG